MTIYEDISSLRIQGAVHIAIESLKFLHSHAKKRGFNRDFDRAMQKLEKTRPTAVVLHNCLEILQKEKSLDTIEELISSLQSNNISEIGAKAIGKGKTIMTHCHSSEAVSAIIKSHPKKVYARITEPKRQGLITTKELSRAGINTTLIIDSADGFFINDTDIVVVGADSLRLRKPEGLVNKIGTYPLAVLAKESKKPFYVIANSLKIDKRDKLIIEERSHKEVAAVKEVRNPAFDVTPWKYISKIITEKGVFTPVRLREEQ